MTAAAGDAVGTTRLLELIEQSASSPADLAQGLPAAAYWDPGILELERRAIFRREWMAVGRVDEIEAVGSYLTTSIDRVPILVTRQRDGSIHSFANVCPHRGMRLVDGCGRVQRFTCRYHGWSFGLDGALLAAPRMGHRFDRAEYSLIRLRTEVALGFVFVSLDPDAPSIARRLAPLTERLAPFQVERMRTLRKDVLAWNCNWKVALENGIEPYHIAATHGTTLAPYAPVQNVEMEPAADGFHAYDHRFDDAVPDPTAPGFIPNTSGIDAVRGYAVAGCIYPNMAFSVAYDWMWWITCHPDGTGRARIEHGVAGPFDLGGGLPDLSEPSFAFLNIDTAFMPEDVPRVEGVQVGMESGFFRQAPLSPLEETVRGFVSYYARQLRSFAG